MRRVLDRGLLIGIICFSLIVTHAGLAQPPGGEPESTPSPATQPKKLSPAERAAAERIFATDAKLSFSTASAEVKPGTIRVEVIDENKMPAKKIKVRLGVMSSEQDRSSEFSTTNEEGVAYFSPKLEKRNAYRVSVNYQGANYGADPFRFEKDKGQVVRLQVLPTTTEAGKVFIFEGRTLVDFDEGRAKVTQSFELANPNNKTYLFPAEGTQIPLPENYTNFNAQKSMSDHKISANEGVVVITGSMSPGRRTIAYNYDLPLDGDTLSIDQPMPFPVYRYQVGTLATGELGLEVSNFPAASKHEFSGQEVWTTSLQQAPGDERLSSIDIVITGIPGPGPYRVLAIVLSILVILVLGSLLWRNRQQPKDKSDAQKAYVDQLLQELCLLAQEKEAGEIGPEFFAEEKTRLRQEIAWTLKSKRAS